MRSVVYGGAVAALTGLIFGAGMKAPIGRELPRPELQQVSYPVETVSQEDFRPGYAVAAAYAPADWASAQPLLWRSAYAAAPDASAQVGTPAADEFAADEPPLNADPADLQAEASAARGDAAMPYASGMSTRSDAARDEAPQARPASSWPNRRGDTKQQVFNGADGFEHVAADEAAA